MNDEINMVVVPVAIVAFMLGVSVGRIDNSLTGCEATLKITQRRLDNEILLRNTDRDYFTEKYISLQDRTNEKY